MSTPSYLRKGQSLNLAVPAIFAADSYKLSHADQYPQGMTRLFSTWTPRSNRLAVITGRQLPDQPDEVVNFGFHSAVHDLRELFEIWFQRSTHEVVLEYVWFMESFMKLEATVEQIDRVRNLHELGYLPIDFYALPEGAVTKAGVVHATIINTHDDFAWVTNYIESALSTMAWKGSTSATIARNYRKTAIKYADLTCDNQGHLDWQLHDFSMRGLSYMIDSERSALGHLLFSSGTDNLPSLFAATAAYPDFEVSDYGSVPATEHSVMCAGGSDDELETFERLLDAYPTGILSVVSDTWDFWHVLTNILPKLKDKIMARDGKLVIRPDSGDPQKIVCGDRASGLSRDDPAFWGAVTLLATTFGATVNSKGFIELDPHIGLIYGDSITLERADAILNNLMDDGYAANCVVLGVGSYTYQCVTRDTFGYAMKATAAKVNGVDIPLFKDPATDTGKTKKSFKGYLVTVFDKDADLVEDDYLTIDGFATFEEAMAYPGNAFERITLGTFFHRSWADVKARANICL